MPFSTIAKMKSLDLIAHPEGGRFREVFRSPHRVTTAQGNNRSALTHIYFSLGAQEVSRFHRVSADEIWNLYQGAGLRLYIWDGTPSPPTCLQLSVADNCYCQVVPAGWWQAAEPCSEDILVGCSVAPGFEFADFELMQPDTPAAQLISVLDPSLARFIQPSHSLKGS